MPLLGPRPYSRPVILSMSELQVGERLDHFCIERLAAQSGMAAIYRATDVRNGRIVAIKVPHFEVESDPVLFDRFKREEEIGKRLNHPGVMKVFDAEDRSRVYMVMEWIDGRLLRRILSDEKKLTIERAVRVTVEICEALRYIHSQGVVHRDLEARKYHGGFRRPDQIDRFRDRKQRGDQASDVWKAYLVRWVRPTTYHLNR